MTEQFTDKEAKRGFHLAENAIMEAEARGERRIKDALSTALAERDEARRELACRDALIKDHLAKILHLENSVDAEAFRAEQAEAENKRLRAALEPFAKMPIGVVDEDGPIFGRCHDDTEVYQTHGWPGDQSAVVTVGDFRKARAAFQGVKAQ